MRRSVLTLVAAGAVTIAAQDLPAPAQLAAGDRFLADLRYVDAIDAYRRARNTEDAALRVRAGAGVIRTLLRLGHEFLSRYKVAIDLGRREVGLQPSR